jgi:hypothetical protein
MGLRGGRQRQYDGQSRDGVSNYPHGIAPPQGR